MKIKLFFIPFILFAFACQNTPKQVEEKVKEHTKEVVLANAQKIEINIEGMTCTGCENTIKNTIGGFEGVYSTDADFEKGIAVLEIDSTKVDISKIEEAINEVGYKATGHKKMSE